MHATQSMLRYSDRPTKVSPCPEGGNKCQHIKEWDKDMTQLIQEWRQEGAEVSLMVDANVSLEGKALGELIVAAE
eukprot:7088342-Ditylum_brightwellii.AAC.1